MRYPYPDGTPVRFRLTETPTYDGFAHGSTWNGWDNVYVTPEVRDAIVADLRAMARVESPENEADYVGGIDEIPTFEKDGAMFVSLGWGFVAQIVEAR